MAYGGAATQRRGDLGKILAVVFEALGVLNKGSSSAPAAPGAGESGGAQPVAANALNVTRVTGLGALISGTGAAALALFSVDKGRDPQAIVVAAYASVGAIVVAALVTVAVIVAADIRARAAIATATTTAPVAAAPQPDGDGAQPPAGPPAAQPAETEVVLAAGHTVLLRWTGSGWEIVSTSA